MLKRILHPAHRRMFAVLDLDPVLLPASACGVVARGCAMEREEDADFNVRICRIIHLKL